MNRELLEHSIDVAALSTNIAYEMGMCPYMVTQIGLAALYHDIGKECLPKVILEKKGKLSDKEKKIMTFHTYIGNSILTLLNDDISEVASEVALNHHEHYDGTGYYKKRYDEVSLATRIITVVSRMFYLHRISRCPFYVLSQLCHYVLVLQP